MDIGFESAGFQVVWTNEFNPEFADMYESAYSTWRKWKHLPGGTKITNRKSITRLKAVDVRKEAFGKYPPKFFGVIGGPPCTDFSQGGKKKGFNGKHGRLTKVYLRMVLSLNPSFFVMENVPYLKKIHREKKVLEKLLKKISKKGTYVIWVHVLNSLELGVPQDRERLFVFGIKKKLLKSNMREKKEQAKFKWPLEKKYSNVKKLKWPKTNKFGYTPKKPKKIPYELTVHNAFTKGGSAEKLPNGQDCFKPKSKKFWHRPEGKVAGMSFKRLHRYRYSPTAWYGNNEVHLHPWKARRISVREALRLQTVPDSYILPKESTLSAKFKMICNGVPCLMAEKVARSVKTFVNLKTKVQTGV
jgi:DNA (cytosine-5)-methyltransferase 1